MFNFKTADTSLGGAFISLLITAIAFLVAPGAAHASLSVNGAAADANTITVSGNDLLLANYVKVQSASPLRTFVYYRADCECKDNPGATIIWNNDSVTIVDEDLGGSYIKNVLFLHYVDPESTVRTMTTNFKLTPMLYIPTEGTAPTNLALPLISGNGNVGSPLGCSTGTWNATPAATYSYQWHRNSNPIGGADDSGYVLQEADLGADITCVVTADNAHGSDSAESLPIGPVAPTLEFEPDLVFVGGGTACATQTFVAYCWGQGGSGQLGNQDTQNNDSAVAVHAAGALDNADIVHMSVGSAHSCAIADENVYCWGDNSFGQLGTGDFANKMEPTLVSALSGQTVTRVTAGWKTTCAIGDGIAYCWGDGVTTPTAVSPLGAMAGRVVTDISTANNYTCAIGELGGASRAYCWGEGTSGQLGNGGNADSSVPVAVDTSGVLGTQNVSKLTRGASSACTIAGGQVYCWGQGTSGQLGNGISADSNVPVLVSGLTGKTVTDIAGATGYACAVADGKAYCWGSGHLGNGSVFSTATPYPVSGLDGKVVTGVSVGDNMACAVADSSVYCWGDAPLGDGTSNPSNVPVAVVF